MRQSLRIVMAQLNLRVGDVQGNVERMKAAPGRPVPHMGWSKLSVMGFGHGVEAGDYVYFAHSFRCASGPHVFAWASHGGAIPAALAKGIKLFAVGASGLEPEGEYIYRQMAQYTAGRFVFLTYRDGADPSSGPGAETVHDVRNYSVQTLDRLGGPAGVSAAR